MTMTDEEIKQRMLENIKDCKQAILITVANSNPCHATLNMNAIEVMGYLDAVKLVFIEKLLRKQPKEQ